MQIFNINKPVTIRLTEVGIEILKKYEEEQLNWVTERYKRSPFFEEHINNTKLTFPKINEDNLCQMPLRDIMELFGNYMHPGQEPFDFDIAISEEYLEEQKQTNRGLK